jgi:TctA family transporter
LPFKEVVEMSSNSHLYQVASKPAVLLGCLGPVPYEWLSAVQVGLEEEGIPWEMCDVTASSMVSAASELAKSSRINTGLVLSNQVSGEVGAVLHHRELPVEKPLMTLTRREISPLQLQRLGQNGARLVKGDPFILS